MDDLIPTAISNATIPLVAITAEGASSALPLPSFSLSLTCTSQSHSRPRDLPTTRSCSSRRSSTSSATATTDVAPFARDPDPRFPFPFHLLHLPQLQGLMGLIVMGSLVLKRAQEKPKRKWRVWSGDVGKQVSVRSGSRRGVTGLCQALR